MSTVLTTISKHRHMVLLIVSFLFVSAVRFIISWPIQWTHIPDAAWYASSANSFYDSFQLLIGGRFNSFSLPLYSVFISPAYFFGDMEDTFIAIKLINSFVMSSAMFPVFLLARRFMPFAWSFTVALLSAMIGPMFYTFTIMSESLHYPLIMWIFYLIHMSLITHDKRIDIILGIVFALALLNKMSSLAIFVSYIFLMGLISEASIGFAAVRRFPRVYLQALLRYRYVFITFVITVLPYIFYRAIATHNNAVVPYANVWRKFFRNITDFDILKYLKWFFIYLGQLNLSTGLFMLPLSAFMIVLLCKSNRREENLFGIFSLIVMTGVLSLAVLQSGYNLERLTERHFFVLTPLIFILAFLWFLGPKKRIPGIWWGVICITAIISSWSALFLESRTAWPACDSALFDSLQSAKAHGVSEFAVKVILLIISSCLILLTRFVSHTWMTRITVAVVFLFMTTITVSVYSQSTRQLQRLRKTRWPMVQWLSDCIVSPANIVLMGVPRRIAADYMIWNRDSQSKMLWQAREPLENPSGFRFEDFLKVNQVLNKKNPTYVISPVFRYSGAIVVDSRYGLDLYKKNNSEEIALTGFSLDFGTGYTRQFLKKGWRWNEGPYPGGWPTFVWGMGPQAELDIYTGSVASDKVLSFRAKSTIHDQSVNIVFNESDICTIDIQPGWHEYRIPIAAKHLKIGKNILTFNFKYPKASSEFAGKDCRKRAMAFDWLTLEDAATLESLKTTE